MTKEEDFTNNSYEHRGRIITEFATMEKIIESIIATYFIDSSKSFTKTSLFQSIVLDRMTFEAKRTSLRSIFEHLELIKGFVKTKKNSYPNSKLFEEIRLLNDQRNYFAHYILAFPFSENNSVISLAETRDKVKILYYKKEDIENIIERIDNAINKICDLTEEYRREGLI